MATCRGAAAALVGVTFLVVKSKRSALVLMVGSALSLAVGRAIGASNPIIPLQGYSRVQWIALTAEERVSINLRCEGGVDGTCKRTARMHRFAHSGGTIEIWEDSRFTAELRRRLWGRGGIVMLGGRTDPITKNFYQRREKDALVILRDTAGRIRDELKVNWPLMEIRQPLSVRPGVRTYLVAIDTSGPSARSGVSGRFLDINAAQGLLRFEDYIAPKSVLIRYPDGVTLRHAWRSRGHVEVPPNGQFVFTGPSGDRPAAFQSSSCAIDSYIDPKTNQYVFETGDNRVSGQLAGDVWRETVRVDFRSCQDF